MSLYMSDSDDDQIPLAEADVNRIRSMLFSAKAHYVEKGYPPGAAYKKAAQAVYEKTGEDVARLWNCHDRDGYVEEEGGDVGRRGGRSAESTWNEESPRSTSPRRGAGRKQSAGTDYDRMFQNGSDLNASRTSGKILSREEIGMRANQIRMELIMKGANPEHARQEGEKFMVREMGKRTRTELERNGYPKDFNIDEEMEMQGRSCEMREEPRQRRGSQFQWGDDEKTERPREARGQPRQRKRQQFRWVGDEDDGPAGRGQSSRSQCGSSRGYSEEELRCLAEQIYDEWIEKGSHPTEARREPRKWYDRNQGGGTGSSSRRSGLDSSSRMRESLDDEDSLPRRSRSSRNPRSAAAEEPPRYSSHGSNRGYRTEERRPKDFENGNYNGYDDNDDLPAGVRPDTDLYVLLGVSKSATAEQIKTAHRKLCIKHHPDRVQGGPAAKQKATEKMAQINQACDVLKDGEMRAFYDRTGFIASMGESPDA